MGDRAKPFEPPACVPPLATALPHGNGVDKSAPGALPVVVAPCADESPEQRELQALRLTCQQLQAALDNERDINVAVGITMLQHRLTRAAATHLLRQTARHRRCKLAVLAAEIILAAQALVLRS